MGINVVSQGLVVLEHHLDNNKINYYYYYYSEGQQLTGVA